MPLKGHPPPVRSRWEADDTSGSAAADNFVKDSYRTHVSLRSNSNGGLFFRPSPGENLRFSWPPPQWRLSVLAT